MRTIIASAIVASALIVGGSAFAQSAGDGAGSTAAPNATQFAASSQYNVRVGAERFAPADRITAQAATSQGFAPVDTMNLTNGSSR